MPRQFTLEYWEDSGWYVGRLTEVPGVFSQGETLEKLQENILDAYRMMLEVDRIVGDYPLYLIAWEEHLVFVPDSDSRAQCVFVKRNPIPVERRQPRWQERLCS